MSTLTLTGNTQVESVSWFTSCRWSRYIIGVTVSFYNEWKQLQDGRVRDRQGQGESQLEQADLEGRQKENRKRWMERKIE